MSSSSAAQGGEAGEARPSTARWFARIFLTLRGRLLLLVGFAMVPALLFIFFAAARERQAALARMETEAHHLGSLASREHAHQLEGARSLLRRLGGIVACDGGAAAGTCPDYLPALLSGFPQFANIGVADVRGDVVCSAAPIHQPAHLTQNVAFARALASDDVEMGTYVMGLVGRPVLHLARAVRGPDRAACAVLFVAVELGWLDQLARQTNLPGDYQLLITDRTGRVLARSGAAPADPEELRGAFPALAGALERPRGAVLEVGVPPAPRYLVATAMEGIPGIFVVASLPYGRVQSTANTAFYRTLLGLILVTVIAVAAAILAAELSVFRVLRALTRTVRTFGAGDLSARAPLPSSHGELRELAVSFGAMADALEAREREAREAQDRLRALSHRLQAVRDEEAGRIARELHDELGQVLTGLKMQLSSLRRICSGAAAPAGDQAMGQMSEQIDRAIDSVRRISSELRPPVLDRLGLTAAVDWLVREFEVKSGLSVLLQVTDVEEPVDGLVATTLFRVVQEALTNVVRHAGATEVAVHLVGRGERLALTIRDDGRGIETAAAEGPQALGILGMRERVGLVGGSWRMRAEPGKGVTIEVDVPRKPPATVESVAGAVRTP
jgi:signal transduction histidine kinase